MPGAKGRFSFFLLLNFWLALINAGSDSFNKTGTNYQLPEKSGSYSYTSLKHPNTEGQIYSLQSSNAVQGNPGFKENFGYLSLCDNKVNYFFTIYIQIDSHINQFFAKEYLSHIYPSHNFW